MEKLYFNLSEEEISKGRKIILWIVVVVFFIMGVYVAMLRPVFGVQDVKPVNSVALFGLSLLVGLVASYATFKRKDLFFLIDDEKVEFQYGIFKPKKYSFPWSTIREVVLPHKERKAKIIFKDKTSFIIDLSWLKRKKSTLIRKHLFYTARAQNINVLKVLHLSHHKTHSAASHPPQQ
jgi:type III secretory pathway component EscR